MSGYLLLNRRENAKYSEMCKNVFDMGQMHDI